MLDINKILVNPTPLAILGLIIFLLFTYLFKITRYSNNTHSSNMTKFILFFILIISAASIFGCFYIYKLDNQSNNKKIEEKKITILPSTSNTNNVSLASQVNNNHTSAYSSIIKQNEDCSININGSF